MGAQFAEGLETVSSRSLLMWTRIGCAVFTIDDEEEEDDDGGAVGSLECTWPLMVPS